ncbi:MAG: hypothetical protein M1812_006640 [Candelaria pacifica]|nr:MAG: hypothetical protein M1812_006640 [Candelaria pacifica]
MAFNNGVDRLEELRFRDPQSPHNENPFQGYTSRGNASQMSTIPQSSNDARLSLQRRFTADSTMSPIGQQRGLVADPLDLSPTLEKKQAEYEMLKERRRKFEAEMQMIDLRQQREEQEMFQMAEDLNRVHTSAGHSEPATPPEYRDTGFPSSFSRPNRFSASNLTSPTTLHTRDSRSSSQIMSPPRDLIQGPYQAPAVTNKMPSKSVPGSRRNSDERKAEQVHEAKDTNYRSSATPNRYSMPVNGLHSRGRGELPGIASALSLGQINTTGFLFGDDDEKPLTKKEPNSTTSPDVKSYLQINTADDKFPVLIRREDYEGLHLSASSAALDLALSQSPGPESQSNGWPSFARHRPAQHSLPLNTLTSPQEFETAKPASPHSGTPSFESPRTTRQGSRKSMEVKFGPHVEDKRLSQPLITPSSIIQAVPPKLQSSYSTNDIPTMKNTNSLASVGMTHNNHAQQHFHNHNASLGRIPPNAVNNRHSRELSGGDHRREDIVNSFQPFQSGLQGSATPFGPPMSSAASAVNTPSAVTPPGMSAYSSPAYYGGYGMQMMPMGVNSMQMGNQMPLNHQMHMFKPHGIAAYSNYGQFGRYPDSQARVIQQRRMQNGEEENARFANVQLEQLQGEIYALCKDQHGCRYLQKKLEERNPEHVHLIFLETNQHVIELMTDPFGNYLCQKLLEYANDEERTVLINNAAPQMIKVALNQHGTRALQKMIEFISTREQIQTIIFALQDRVVELIQDLNGNHVIQKCLNRLSPEDAQFIFNAVGLNCVVVGTHRHGCCVLQRCIDHASGHQKAQLISHISANAFALVQDPFGNYVVQYILDLNEPAFTDPLCHGFRGHIPALSKQKFSSNVIEKCLRTADPSTKRMMIEEMLNPNELEKMLRDSFANYVVQTAMDYADADTKSHLIETIRPILPAIRATPYGRRIQGKIQDRDGRLSGGSSGQITPNDLSSPGQIPLLRQVTPGFQQRPSTIQPQNHNLMDSTNNGMVPRYGPNNGGISVSNVSNLPSSLHQNTGQGPVQDHFPSYGRSSQPGNLNYF